MPQIWLAELFTPTTISSLIGGVRQLTRRRRGRRSHSYDPVEWINSDRRRGGYNGSRDLPTVRPAETTRGTRAGNFEGALAWLENGEVVDEVPPGIRFIRLELRTLTSTVTALTAQFGLDDDRALGLGGAAFLELGNFWKGMEGPVSEMWEGGPYVAGAKERPAEEWRTSLRQEAADWLAKWFPGFFHRLAPGQLPAIEFLLTGQLRPWEEFRDPLVNGPPDLAKVLDLKYSSRYWQCATIPSLRMQERPEFSGFSWEPESWLGQRHRLVLAALRGSYQEFMADQGGTWATNSFDHSVRELLVRWSLTAFIRELEAQIGRIQDAADQASRERSAQALADTQRQLLQTGIDSQIVVNDIVRYAQARGWGNGVLNFTEVAPQASQRSATEGFPAPRARPVSLTESLRKEQISDGQRVSQLETDLREVLNTSAQLASASENLRLQRMVVWLTVIATIVAIIAAAAAVIALIR
jgi:hypothetical protein